MRAILTEEPLTLSDAAKLLPSRPHKNTLRRWCYAGYQGVRLRSFRAGNRLCTTRAALEEFLAAISYQPATAATMTPAHEAAQERLDALGV